MKSFRLIAAATVTLALLDQRLTPVVEPGAFDVMIGSSSGDIRLKGRFHVVR